MGLVSHCPRPSASGSMRLLAAAAACDLSATPSASPSAKLPFKLEVIAPKAAVVRGSGRRHRRARYSVAMVDIGHEAASAAFRKMFFEIGGSLIGLVVRGQLHRRSCGRRCRRRRLVAVEHRLAGVGRPRVECRCRDRRRARGRSRRPAAAASGRRKAVEWKRGSACIWAMIVTRHRPALRSMPTSANCRPLPAPAERGLACTGRSY